MEYIEDNTYGKLFRFNELVDLVNKADGRRYLTFEDRGYVEDVDLFLTGCLSRLPVNFFLDGGTVHWELLSCTKKFKTMLDFYNGQIKCQGKLITEIEGWRSYNFKNKAVNTYVATSYADEKLINFLKI